MQITSQTPFIGLGVAGNFAGHLEQAGEAADFVAVKVDDKVAPKALFPFYVPNHPGQLGVFPLSGDAIFLPEAAVSGDEKVQIEPEVALWCELEYAGEQVVAIHPKAFGAYNDCSIRRPNAKKISEKKNWGEESKGLAANLLPLTHFAAGCELDDYRIACYLERDGQYLMLHRVKKEHDENHDKWIGVGGKFEDRESPEDCVCREVLEETGLTLTQYRYCGLVTFVSDVYPTEYLHLFHATGFTGTPKDCDEGELAWIGKRQLAALQQWEGDRIFLRLMDEHVPFFSLKLVYAGDTLTEAVLNGQRLEQS